MKDSENYFITLNSINVNDHKEKKNGLDYLSWAWAWGEVKKLFPDATYTIYENKDGLNYHHDGKTAWVKTGVTAEGLEMVEMLPIMDYKNRSIPVEQITSFDVNKAIQRSLTKAVARHGLGLYIYAGEDLPDGEEAAPVVEHPKKNVRDEIARIKGKYGPDGFKQMRESLIAAGIVKDIPSTQMQEADWWALIVAIDQNFGDAA